MNYDGCCTAAIDHGCDYQQLPRTCFTLQKEGKVNFNNEAQTEEEL